MYYGLVNYEKIEDIISSCEGALIVCNENLEIAEQGTLSYAQLLGTKRATEKILNRLKQIHPINIKSE